MTLYTMFPFLSLSLPPSLPLTLALMWFFRDLYVTHWSFSWLNRMLNLLWKRGLFLMHTHTYLSCRTDYYVIISEFSRTMQSWRIEFRKFLFINCKSIKRGTVVESLCCHGLHPANGRASLLQHHIIWGKPDPDFKPNSDPEPDPILYLGPDHDFDTDLDPGPYLDHWSWTPHCSDFLFHSSHIRDFGRDITLHDTLSSGPLKSG